MERGVREGGGERAQPQHLNLVPDSVLNDNVRRPKSIPGKLDPQGASGEKFYNFVQQLYIQK